MTMFSLVRALVAFGVITLAPPAGAAWQTSQGTAIETQGKNCQNASVCAVLLTAIPAGKTLVARNISCRIVFPTGQHRTNLYLSGNGAFSYLLWGTASTVGTSTVNYFNHEIFVPFKPLQRPTLTWSLVANPPLQGAQCTLSGELIP